MCIRNDATHAYVKKYVLLHMYVHMDAFSFAQLQSFESTGQMTAPAPQRGQIQPLHGVITIGSGV
jgi:hypothetical protein